MLLDYYDFPKIPLNRIFCSEPIPNPVEALDTFSDCAFTPSPCLRPSCRGPSSPKEFKPQHHTAIVINQDHNLYPPHDQFFQFTYSRHTAKFTGEISNNIDDYSLAEASTARQLHSHMSTCLSHQLTHFSAIGSRLWRAGMGFDTGSHYNRSA